MPKGVSLAFWVVELALLIVGLNLLFPWFALNDAVLLGVYSGLGLVYCGAGLAALFRTAYRADEGRIAPWSPTRRWMRWFMLATPIVTSGVGLIAAFFAVVSKQLPDEFGSKTAYGIVAAIAMVVSWLILQAGCARLYEAKWHDEGGGLQFPGTPDPQLVDFTYFSYTMGASFAVSDVEATNRRMRVRILVHSVWSFFYNAAIVAMGISILTGSR